MKRAQVDQAAVRGKSSVGRPAVSSKSRLCLAKRRRDLLGTSCLAPVLLLAMVAAAGVLTISPARAQTLPPDGSGGGHSGGGFSNGGGGGGGGGAGLQLTTSNGLSVTVTGGAGGAGGGEGLSGSAGGSGSGTAGGIGGAGGGTVGGSGGTGGGGASGGAGAADNGIDGGLGGGGGGGAGLVINGASLVITSSGAVTGGAGGAGGGANSSFSGYLGNGGAGGAGIASASTGLQVSNSGTITGGAGGDAGFLGFLGSGAINGVGGAGGAGVSLSGDSVTFTNTSTVRGGAGGLLNTINSFTGSGVGGDGGAGLVIAGAGGIVNNSGTILGGAGGYDVDSNVTQGGASGVGVRLSGSGTSLATGTVLTNSVTGVITGASRNLSTAAFGSDNGAAGVSITGDYNSLYNAGTINGGSAGISGVAGVLVTGSNNLIVTSGTINRGATGVPSVQFDGNNNTLELRAGYALNGGAKVNGTGGTLALGGTTNAVLDASRIGSSSNGFTGFSAYTKTGTSTWSLNNANVAVGDWNVQQGTLALNNGAQWTGNIDVASGATLSFGATSVANSVAGTVTIANGAALAATTANPNTQLSGLALNGTSNLNMTVTRAGNTTPLATATSLTLDGTLNITNSANSLAAGTYRLFNTSVLTDNTIVIGTAPIQFAYQIDTSTSTQVNLVVEPNVGYWNGAHSVANGIVNGGSGVWKNSLNNWTNATGIVSKTWGGYEAYFQGDAGTVSIDNGGVTAYLLHFLTDGYVVNLDPLTLASVSAAKPIVEVTSGATATIQSVIEGTAGLDKTGAGTLVLSGTNTYTGNTTISAGTLQIDGTGSILGNVANSGTLVFSPSSDLTFAGNITGAGSLTKSGAGKLTLSGLNTYSGTTTISAGTLQMDVGGNPVLSGAVANSGALIVNANTVTPSGLTISGVISGPGTLTKNGTGALKLTADNTYTGLTTVTDGVLYVGFGTTTGAIAGDIVNNAPVIVGGVNSGKGVAFFRTNASTYGGVISGTGQVGVGGGGSLTLTGENTYTGGTFITGATLIIGDGATSGSVVGDIQTSFPSNPAGTVAFNRSDLVTFPGAIFGTGGLEQRGTGTLLLTGANTYGGSTVITRGTIQVGDGISGSLPTATNVTNDGALVFNQGADATLSGVISGTGSVTKMGSTTLTLTGLSTYSGATNVMAGELLVSGAGAGIGDLSAVTVASGATFRIANHDETIGSLAGAGNVTVGARQLTVGGDNTSTTYSGAMAGSGAISLVKAGSGTMTLSGTNTYTGATQVNGGELRVNGSIQGAVGVASGATLSGSGAIGGAVTVASGGTLSAGSSPGTLTVGSLVLDSGSNTVFELNNPGAIGGPGNDYVIVNGVGAAGNLALGGTLTANVGSAGYYRLFDVTGGGTVSGSFDTLALTAPSVAGAVGTVYNAPSGAPTQVNLSVLGTGQTIQFWDGGDQLGNGTVDGGAGTWSAGNANWTGAPGQADFNAPWAGSVGVFQGTAGAVTVAGTQSFDTLQFNSDGYALSGGSLSFGVAGGGTINISAGVTTTIASSLVDGTGSGLTKVGAGTLVLSGSNSYTGGTTIAGGTLSVSSDANLGDAAGAVTFNGGTLATTASFDTTRSVTLTGAGGVDVSTGTQLGLGGPVSGPGSLAKLGAGTLVLSGASNYTGATLVQAGTLRAGAAGTLASASAFSVSAGATLDLAGFDHSIASLEGAGAVTLGAATLSLGSNGQDTAFSGAITGSGGLTKTGGGSLSLSGSNGYAGATSVQAGTLRAGAAEAFASGSAFSVSAGATLDLAGFNQGIGSLAGAGSVTLGAATLTTGSSNASTTFSGAISGTGGLTKTGTGAFTLSGVNTYTGTTKIDAGTLTVMGGSAISDQGRVTIASGATLDVAQSETIGSLVGDAGSIVTLAAGQTLTTSDNSGASFAGAIAGAGDFKQDFVGKTTVSGTSSYTGATFVTRGTLVVNGSIASSSGLTVDAGGTIAGSGQLPSTVVNGTISPGNSPGTLTVNGNLTLGAGSLYLAEIQGAVSDRVNVTGTASLAGTLRIVPLGGSYVFSTPYTLLSAQGGRSGTFGTVDTTGSFGDGVATTVAYTASDVQLTLAPKPLAPIVDPVVPPTEPPATPGVTPAEPGSRLGVGRPANAYAVAAGIDRAVAAGANPSALFGLYNLPAAAIPAAVNQLSGEVHTAAPAMAVSAADQFLRAMLDPSAAGRLGEASPAPGAATFSGSVTKGHDVPVVLNPPRYSVWGAAFGSVGRTDGDVRAGSARRDLDDAHLAVGADVRLAPGTVAGFAVAGGSARTSLAGGLGKADAEAFQAGLYGMTRLGPINLAAALGYARLENDVNRSAPALGSALSSSYVTTAWSGRFQASAAVASWNGLTLSPLAALQAIQVRSPGVAEASWSGASAGALSLARRNEVTSRSELGLQLDVQAMLGATPVSGYVRASWAHYFQRDADLSASLIGLPGASFAVQGAKPARNAALITTGFDVRLTPNVTLGARFDGELSGTTNRYGGSAQLKVSF
ncbi:autotransporter-associated beta strand repeat-containing protein [Bosea sp. BK604]|uniref:autotransporter-associated beta strand repeat-containing protein n=1 Tax=Bosea sp. BK604 TaxID=2512180 RepID=UPI0010EFE958|nr:autotransporter-associated beta strand repeat-containing protein [Bosea sp. BK604]TCR65372.1 autotransporter-associated beta strand protein [Bosea sp. BK604]